MKRLLSIILVLAMLLTTATVFAETTTKDVMDYTGTPGELLQFIGVIQGDNAGNLNAEGTLTREEMVTILVRLTSNLETDFVTPDVATFTDMPTTHWAFRDVEYAVANGITSGIGGNMFGTAQEVTYQQAVAFLLKALGVEFKWENTIMTGFEQSYAFHSFFGSTADKLLRKHIFDLTVSALFNNNKEGIELLRVSDRYESEVVEQVLANKFDIKVVFNEQTNQAILDEMKVDIAEGASTEKTNTLFPDFNEKADKSLISQYNKYVTADYVAVDYKELEATVLAGTTFSYTVNQYDKSRENSSLDYNLETTVGANLDRIGVTGEDNLYIAFCDLGLDDKGQMMQGAELWSFGDVQYNSENGYYSAQINLPKIWDTSEFNTPAFGFFTVKDGKVVDTQIFYTFGVGTLTK